jgi:DNA-binding FadR family transcriptional regulator
MTTVNPRPQARAKPPANDQAGPAGERSGLPVQRLKPAYQQVADQLRDLIISRELAWGDRLPPEGELGSWFGVSRSTVREALRVLASQGLVETTRGTTGGTFVARIRPAAVTSYLEASIGLMSGTEDLTLADLLEARELIEVPAAALAAERHHPEHVDALRAAIAREKASRGRSGKFSEHRQFHGLIIAATGNGLLRMTTDPIFRVLQTHLHQQVDEQDFWSTVDREHELVVDRIAHGDGPGAAAAMRAHLASIRPAYRD